MMGKRTGPIQGRAPGRGGIQNGERSRQGWSLQTRGVQAGERGPSRGREGSRQGRGPGCPVLLLLALISYSVHKKKRCEKTPFQAFHDWASFWKQNLVSLNILLCATLRFL